MELPLPERALIAKVTVAGQPINVAAYYAPPGVTWKVKKAQQAVGFARWLAALDGPTFFGADANTPRLDAVDFAQTRTHWHTGCPRLKGEPGDDLLFGPDKIHDLQDALRRWFFTHPAELAAITANQPLGPLALSHRTGKRATTPGTDRRYDALWISDHFTVTGIEYLYDAAIVAGSDHAAVVVDLELSNTTLR